MANEYDENTYFFMPYGTPAPFGFGGLSFTPRVALPDDDHNRLRTAATLEGQSPYWSIVKNACIAECSDILPTPRRSAGAPFFNCVNECMKRHNQDPFSFRP